MPAKRKLLPRPCPIKGCGKKYGTFQLVLFNSKYSDSRSYLVCRIRHYNSKQYKRIKDKIKNKAKDGLYQKQWHSFRLEGFGGIVKSSGDRVPHCDYFKETGQTHLKSKTWKPTEQICNMVKKQGWRPMPDESVFYRRHTPKNEE
jgi:hypothetical protein